MSTTKSNCLVNILCNLLSLGILVITLPVNKTPKSRDVK